MSTTESDTRVEYARAKVQDWGRAAARGTWDWHSLGQALQLTHEAIELSPAYQRPWTLLADIYHRIGRKELAETCLQRSFRLATPGPNHPGRFYREVRDHLRSGYPFNAGGGLKRQQAPDWFVRKYQRYWSIDEVLLARNRVEAPSAVATAFLSYVKEDRARADRLRSDLLLRGIAVWMDTHELLPGQEWELVIRETLTSRDFVLCCLSEASVSKVSVFQAEVKQALSAQEKRPPGAVYLIPVRFEDCEVPPTLKTLQYVDLFPETHWADGIDRIDQTICRALGLVTVPGNETKV